MESTKKPKFPLPRGYFGKIEFSKQQQDQYRELCETQVQKALEDERLFAQNRRQVDKRQWKSVKSHHSLQLYRRRDAGLFEKDGKPSMIAVGHIEGSIEDALYGSYDQTDEEVRVTAELIETYFADGAVLSTMERGSPTDPYRVLSIKWILTPFPVPVIMPDRDWILLESMGIAYDSNGQRYGYHTLKTVEVPECPEFPEVIRGTMWYTFIYRDAGVGTIDVFSQGFFDCLGDLIDALTVVGSSHMFNGVFNYMKSAEAKKLSILALESLERRVQLGLPPSIDESTIPANACCSICAKIRSTTPFSSRRMRICHICDEVVCMSCRVKKNILVGRLRVRSKVSICHRCIAHAKTLVVNPTDTKYEVTRELQTFTRDHASSYPCATFEMARLNSHTSRFEESADFNGPDSWSGLTRMTDVESEGGLDDYSQSARVHEDDLPSQREYRSASATVAGASAENLSGTLIDRMKELQLAAKRAQFLTEASRVAMLESSTHK